MLKPRILAFSSSREGNSAFLETAVPYIKNFLGDSSLNIAFIPFASVDDYEVYENKVKDGLKGLPYTINAAKPNTAKEVIEQCDVIMVGGGNTFKLLHDLYRYELLGLIQHKVNSGAPYIGWSAGSNITGATIATTNDMPIIEPKSFKALAFFPFQINPHYINVKPEGFNGETRDERLAEFIKLNPEVPVIGLPEGTALLMDEGILKVIGTSPAVLFNYLDNIPRTEKKNIASNTNVTYLL